MKNRDMTTEIIEKVKNDGTNLSRLFILNAIKQAEKETSAELAYELACCVDAYDLKNRDEIKRKLETVVINSRDSKYAYLFAKDVPNAKTDVLLNVIIKQKDAISACMAARDIPSKKSRALEKVVINSCNPAAAVEFAYSVKGANVSELCNVVIKSKKTEYIKDFILNAEFIENITKSDIKKLMVAYARNNKERKTEKKPETKTL